MKIIASNLTDLKWRFSRSTLNPDNTDIKTIEKIKNLFTLLKDNYSNLSKENDSEIYILYLRVPRGKYEDDESYKSYLKYGEIKEANYIKNNWDKDYPKCCKWFKLFFQHSVYEGVNYYAFLLDNQQVLYLSDKEYDSYDHGFYSYLIKAMSSAIRSHIKVNTNNKFQKMFVKTFGYEKRKGIIEYKQAWKIYPSLKRNYMKEFKGIDINYLFEEANKEEITYFPKFTSGKYYDICKIGYLAIDNEIDVNIDSKSLFYHKADGRTHGLEDIDLNSEEDFDAWFKEYGNNPDHDFEILPGRSFYRGDLWIDKDDKGYYLSLSGNNYFTQIKIMKIYNALLNKGIKVKLYYQDLFKSRIDGTAIFAIESEDNWCYGYTTVFGKSYIDSIHISDFPKLTPFVKWEDVKMSQYIGDKKL